MNNKDLLDLIDYSVPHLWATLLLVQELRRHRKNSIPTQDFTPHRSSSILKQAGFALHES